MQERKMHFEHIQKKYKSNRFNNNNKLTKMENTPTDSEYPIPLEDIIHLDIKLLNREMKKMKIPKEKKDEIKNIRRIERAKLYDTVKREATNSEIQRLENEKMLLKEELLQLQLECNSLDQMANHLVKTL